MCDALECLPSPDFPQPGFESKEPLPSVELRYPSGAREKWVANRLFVVVNNHLADSVTRFILLTPISSREYNPISELRNAIRVLLKRELWLVQPL